MKKLQTLSWEHKGIKVKGARMGYVVQLPEGMISVKTTEDAIDVIEMYLKG